MKLEDTLREFAGSIADHSTAGASTTKPGRRQVRKDVLKGLTHGCQISIKFGLAGLQSLFLVRARISAQN